MHCIQVAVTMNLSAIARTVTRFSSLEHFAWPALGTSIRETLRKLHVVISPPWSKSLIVPHGYQVLRESRGLEPWLRGGWRHVVALKMHVRKRCRSSRGEERGEEWMPARVLVHATGNAHTVDEFFSSLCNSGLDVKAEAGTRLAMF